MGFRINTNTSADFTNFYGRLTQQKIDSSMEKLSTGLRLNRAADDAAGMSIANQLRSQHEGLAQANKNAQDGISLVKIADGALEEYSQLLVTARDKSIQAANDTNSVESRAALEEDVKQLMDQADRIAKTTSFNGINLLDGSFANKVLHVGSESGQTMNISIANADIAGQAVADADIDLTTQLGAEAAITSFDAAIKGIDAIRSNIGSTQISLESRVRVNSITEINVAAAESQIRDVDYALEQERLTTNNIKLQANVFALGKTFENQQMVLGFLR